MSYVHDDDYLAAVVPVAAPFLPLHHWTMILYYYDP